MLRNFLKGIPGDINNALLAAIGFNLKKMLNRIRQAPESFIQEIFRRIIIILYTQNQKVRF